MHRRAIRLATERTAAMALFSDSHETIDAHGCRDHYSHVEVPEDVRELHVDVGGGSASRFDRSVDLAPQR
jgi:hypothetical protein